MTQSANLNVMTAAVLKAAKGLQRDFGEVDQLQISRKGTSNFVTKSDVRTEKLLMSELKRARPDYAFLVEESGDSGSSDAPFRWVIDPLDGTNNFIHAVPYFCISVALEKRMSSGRYEPSAAVTYDPIQNELFCAEHAKGATLNGRRIAVSRRAKPDELMFASNAPKGPTEGGFLREKRVAESGAAVRYLGATALDLANIAAGRLDGAWYASVHPWDIAAGILLIREAGGTVTDFAGKPAYSDSANLLAANRQAHGALSNLITASAN